MAISFKEKLAYINKYAKGNDKLVKAVQLGKALEKVKDDTQREKIKKAVNDAFIQIKKINTASSTKTSTAKTALTKQQKIDKEIEKFKKNIGRTKWLTATRYMTNSGLRKTTIEKDAQIPALPKGKRISRKTGKPYWENRANRSDVKQPPVDYPKLAKGGEVAEKFILSFNYNPSNLSNKEAEKIVSKYTKNWKRDNDFDEVSFFVMDLKKSQSNELEQELKMEDVYNIEITKSRYSEGGQTDENFKVGDKIKVLGDSYTILSFRVDKSQGYEEKRVIMKNDKGETLSYPLDMVIAYSKYANGGEMEKIDQRMYNFLEEDLATLEQSINEDDQDAIEKFFSYWIGTYGHIKSLKNKSNERMYNFLEDDLATLEQSIIKNDNEKIEQFFSYWGQHLNSIRYANGGEVGTFPFLKYEDAQDAMKRVNQGELPKNFSYVEKEKTLYYLPNIVGKFVKLKSFKSKKDSIDWIKSNLQQEGFAKGGMVYNWKEFYEMSKDTSGYNPEYEKKFGSYKYQAPHIQEILSNSKSFEDFMNRKNRFQQSKDMDASQYYWSEMDTRSKKAWLLMSGFNESDSNDLLSKQWDDLSNGQKAKLTRGLIKQGDNKSSVFFSEYEIESDKFAEGGQIGSGKNGYVAFYKGKRIEVYADTKYQAQQLAAKHFNAKKEWEVNVVLAEVDGKPYVQSTAFAKGGTTASKKWVVNFSSEDDSKTKYVTARSESEAINKGFMALSNDGEDSDDFSVDSVYQEGQYAKGGMVEHGLKKGDKVVDSFHNVVIVENEGKTFVVNLNVGKRYSENQWFSMNHGTNSKNSKE